ncbi:potassium voltage-gated channel subfamily KQT member 4 isoform X2 [Dendroctonus ponderosae]|uniref:potassium voltage-gated channel subfamily KQT member 4 isoform X2 n=1 Tax=Dendroctonus ponderosae TaxID=77166 RepID=UPI002035ECAA|nr:potassium voltage-gated channel subfamily KQT member 4 isoform X2 [Dendroctonus ponderosae]
MIMQDLIYFRSALEENNQKAPEGRLFQPRMSLLGKPLNYRASRRDARYRRLQTRIHNFLERPRGFAFIYHFLVFVLVFTGLALSVFCTIQEFEKQAGDVLVYMESIVCTIFFFELVLRTWSSGCRSRYQGFCGKLKFLRSPYCLIDIATIIASVVVVIITIKSGGQVLAASALRGLRFFQILRMARMDRRGGTWKLLISVIYAHRQELMTTLYIGFLGLILASFVVFLVEKDLPNTKFTNFAQALWWGVITLCTVGYGDMVPETWQGKIIASFCSLLGISFFALPAGILGSGFALKVQEQQRQKHMIRRRQPAATLIQSIWRCYAADEKSMSEATWKIHQVRYSPPARLASSFRHNASFVGRFSTIRRNRSPAPCTIPPSPARVHNKTLARMNSTSDYVGSRNSSYGNRNNLNPNFIDDSTAVNDTKINVENQDDDDDEPQLLQLTSQHKAAIRAIRKIKYFVARRKFREALKPYDVKDVIEQYSSGHADLLNRVKNLQYRLDQILGKQGSKSKDVYVSKICLAARVVTVERQVDDIYSKIDQFFDLYMEDRKCFIPNTSHRQMVPTGSPLDDDDDIPPASLKTGTTITNHWNSGVKPKSILVEKQSSVPSLPNIRELDDNGTEISFINRPRYYRGYSDSGTRLKKHVTLSSPCSYSEMPYNGRKRSDEDNEIVTLIVPQIQKKSLLRVPSDGDEAKSTQSSPEFPEPSTSGLSTEVSLDNESGENGYEDEDYDAADNSDHELDEEADEIEDEANETTLLCPAANQNEIIITPSTLNCASKVDVATEDIYMTNFKVPHKRYHRD